jgi:predicted ester cyclase
MSNLDANKAVVREFIDRVFVQLEPDAVDELVADDFQSHAWLTPGTDGKSALRAATGRMGKALDQISFTIDDLIAEDDRVVARLTARARQIGEFMGLPPSNRSYEIGEIHIFRLLDARIIEHWLEADFMGLMKQLKPG